MLAVAGVLALGVGGILLFLSLSLVDASIAIPLSSVSPLFSLMLAKRYSGERITPRIIMGAALIVVGVVLVSFYNHQ